MKLRAIGKTGVQVYPIGLGGMPLSLDERPEEEKAIEVIHAAVDAGINFIDTADVYCIDDRDIGHNEALISKALRQKNLQDKVYVATKGGLRRPNGDWVTDGRPAHLRSACEKSLKHLGVERIFLYQLHAPDSRVPFEDTVGELAKLQKEGKIEHLGLSNVSQVQIDQALKMVRIEAVQNRCNPREKRDFDNGLITYCAERQITFIPHSPVGGYGSGHQRLVQHPTLKKLAQEYGVSPYRLILAWFLAKGSHILPIPGASRTESIRDSAQAATLELKPEDISRIDQI